MLLLAGGGLVVAVAWSVYAGASVAAILLVLTLGQFEGEQPYDRSSWEALLSAATGMVLAGVLSMTLCDLPHGREAPGVGPAEVSSLEPPQTAALCNALIVGSLLFGIGVIGFISRRNMMVMILAFQVMLQGVLLSLAALGRFHEYANVRQLILAVLATATAYGAVSLMIVWTLLRRTGKLDVVAWHGLREANQPPPDEPHV